MKVNVANHVFWMAQIRMAQIQVNNATVGKLPLQFNCFNSIAPILSSDLFSSIHSIQ
jgi:hypothetical protein